jgi:hypothetical protein
MAKYMGKDFSEDEFKGHRRFFCSQSLHRETVMRGDNRDRVLEQLEIGEECKTYGPVTYMNNPFVGSVTYTHYDLRRRS